MLSSHHNVSRGRDYHRAFASPLMQIKDTDDNRNTRPGVAQICGTKTDPGRQKPGPGQ
jgi:hypothetical protein